MFSRLVLSRGGPGLARCLAGLGAAGCSRRVGTSVRGGGGAWGSGAAGEGGGGTADTIQIDRSGLFKGPEEHKDGPKPWKQPETEMVKHLKSLIQFRGGPITVAEYMHEVLTHPTCGFYMHRDVFGEAGDFTTSPEISQMFGEMVGIWSVVTWQQMGSPPVVNLVELGPGRGTLMADLLRGISKFKEFASSLRVHMVEVSPHNRQAQYNALECSPLPPLEPAAAEEGGKGGEGAASGDEDDGTAPVLSGRSGIAGCEVHWHKELGLVPEGPTLLIGHEFLDALPAHQFQKTDRGWCERLVDIADDEDEMHLRFVLSPQPTPSSHLLVRHRLSGLLRSPPPGMSQEEVAQLEHIEISPKSMAISMDIADRIGKHGGGALLFDYGQDRPYGLTVQGIRRHEFVEPLDDPGSADLSAYVDFSAVRQAVEETGADAMAVGPVAQGQFLLAMGMQARLESLLKAATPQQAEDLKSGFLRLVGATDQGAGERGPGMGERYLAMAISHKGIGRPVGF